MKRLIGLIVIFSFLLSGAAQARQQEWPEGWSEETSVGQYSIFSQRFGVAFAPDRELFFIAGLIGHRGNMELVIDFLKLDEKPQHQKRVLVNDNIYFADFPKVFIGSNGKIIVSWVEEVNRERHLKYRVFSSQGDFLEEKTILETPRRISNVYGKTDREGRVHLTWTGLGETGLEVHYSRISEKGHLEFGPFQLTSSDKFSYRGLVIGEEGFLNLFWVELHPVSADLQYRRFNLSGEPVGPIKTISQVSMMDRAGLPVLEINLDATRDSEGNIHLVWNAQGDGAALFRSGSDIFYARFQNGEMDKGPHNLIAYWADAHRPAIATGEDGISIAWEDHIRSPVRIAFFSTERVGGTPTEPVSLNIGTNSAFSPQIFLDNYGNDHVFWYNFFQDQRMIEVKTINNRFPVRPSFWYVVGLGLENPLQRLVYILGLNLFLSILNSLTQFHFLVIILLGLGYLGQILDLPKYTWLVVLTGFAFIFLLQETGWYYTPKYVDQGLELLNAALAAIFAIFFVRSFKGWVGIRDTVGQFIVFWLFIYWHTFFSFIPHYIQDIIP